MTGAKKKLKENKTDTIDNIKIVNYLKDIRGFLVKLLESCKQLYILSLMEKKHKS